MGLSIEKQTGTSMTLDTIHIPVLLDETLELFAPVASHSGAIIVDATLGMGGHSLALLTAFPQLRIIGLDRDPEALQIATQRLTAFTDRFTAVRAVFDELSEVLQDLGITSINGAFFDLGVSSLQLDEPKRGFAYAQDAPLDMRMDPATELTAADILSTYSEGTLRAIFERFGEEKLAGRYARAIISARQHEAITRSGQLVSILSEATPAALRDQRHPAKRVFQALRIEVNAELTVLTRAIPQALDALALHGRIVFLSYHSLEDRIVKRALTERATSTAPSGMPVELESQKPQLKLLTRGAQQASPAECERNPRARSVRLRAAERIRLSA